MAFGLYYGERALQQMSANRIAGFLGKTDLQSYLPMIAFSLTKANSIRWLPNSDYYEGAAKASKPLKAIIVGFLG
jgi:hypothetical protein